MVDREGSWPAVRPQPTGERHTQSGDQCARRDARRRRAHDRDGQCHSWTTLTPLARTRCELGEYICVCVTDTGSGCRRRLLARGVRPVLHDQAHRPGHRAWPVHGLWIRPAVQGQRPDRERDRQGHDGELYFPRYKGAVEARRDRSAETPRGAGERSSGRGRRTVRMLIVEVLRELGYACVEARRAVWPANPAFGHSDRSSRHGRWASWPERPPARRSARDRRPDLKVLFMTGYAENAAFAAASSSQAWR